MSLLTPADLVAALPADLRDAASRDRNGEVVLEQVIAAAEREVRAAAGSASVPPTTLRQAALWIALDMLAMRRGLEVKRFSQLADYWRKYLREAAEKAGAIVSNPGAVISEPAPIGDRRLLA